MFRRFRWIIIIAVVVLGIWVLRATVLAPKPIAVETATVERGVVEETVTNSQAATVRSRLRTRVGTKVIGLVDRLCCADISTQHPYQNVSIKDH